MTKPIVSIIIPAYNEEKFIGKTLESVKNAIQKYGNPDAVEVIVVNNNSSDRTEEIAKGYSTKVVFEKENHIAKARNSGVSCATGKYLIFLDADTLIHKNLICRAEDLLSTGKIVGGGAFVECDKYWDDKLIYKLLNYLCRLIKKCYGAFLFCDPTWYKVKR